MAQEHIPDGNNLSKVGAFHEPGSYRDPQSGAVLEVSMPAGADALVRMGWKKIATKETKPGKSAKPEPTAKVDDADKVEEEQDNAPGHKSEDVDGKPGVPAGDPEKLAKK